MFLDEFRLAVVGAEPDERLRPEVVPPGLIAGKEAVPSGVGGCVEVGERGGLDVGVAVERACARDENRHRLAARRERQGQFTFVDLLDPARPAERADGDR